MSGQRAFGEIMHDFEEVARWLPLIGDGDVKLEVRFGATHGQPPHRESSLLGQRQQRIDVCKCGNARVMHDQPR